MCLLNETAQLFVQDKEDGAEAEAEAGPVEVVVVVEGRSSEQISSSQTNTGDNLSYFHRAL